MTFSRYLSKRIAWDSPLRLPRLSIPALFQPQAMNSSAPKYQEFDEASTGITAISYPPSPVKSKRAKLHAYIRYTSEPLLRRFRLQPNVLVSESTTAKLNAVDMPIIHSIFQLPSSPPSPITPSISPTSTFQIPELATVSQLQTDRAIRAEQEAAYERAQKLDHSLLERLREERLHGEEQSRELAEQEEQARTREREEAAYRHAQNNWRRWARRTLIRVPQVENVVHFAVRLPCGQRYIGNLPLDASLEAFYLFVETLFIPPSYRPEDDPEDPPEGYEHHSGFRLVTTNSRFVLPNSFTPKISELEIMRKGVLLVVEEVGNTDLGVSRKMI
ncbi:hypothetical protein V565_133240 [Rhizoctonia solani 123E]|uniref:UBX domain protein n=1 Tax=Rhizoctonia solani 123E TaxID=1423351 RepID=A0A074RS23_9AGAM|nr:hypothetical protein V565_133240 [Rhizoctonia solani 123E]